MAVKVNIVNMPNTIKQSGRRIRTQLGVLHSAECPLKRGYPMSLTQWTIDTAVEASWHEFVGPGVVVQAVHSDYIAWHASVANWISWGTEQTGYAAYSRAQWLTKDGRDQLERLAMQWAADAKYFGWKLADLRWLPTGTVRAIVAGNDATTKGFCTHAQVDPASRTDPGPNYPYDLLMQRVRYHFSGGFQSGNFTPIQEDDMATPKETWAYKRAGEEIDASQMLRYLYEAAKRIERALKAITPAKFWAHPIESRYDKPDAKGVRPSYPAEAHLSVINLAANVYRHGDGRDAIIKELVAEIVKANPGQQLDVEDLVARVTVGAEVGVKNAIDSIEKTETTTVRFEEKSNG